MEDEYITSIEANKFLNYADHSSVARLARYKKVRTKKENSKKYLYHKGDLLRAFHERNPTKMVNDIEPNIRKFNTYQKVEDNVIIIADAHCPMIDRDLFKQALRTKDELKIETLILAGDTLDCSAQSKFYDLFPIPWDEEKRVARWFLKQCAKEFDRIYILTANHELRYMKKLGTSYAPDIIEGDKGEKLDIWEIIFSEIDEKFVKKCRVSLYPYCDVGETWRICHPSTARKQPLSLARELCQIYGKSIVVSHAHMSGWAFAPNPKYQIVDTGVFADPQYFGYKQLRITAHYQWTESFITIKDEWANLYVKGHKDSVTKKT